MSAVILVGAGATLAEALPTNPSRSMTPPLDRTFFRLCAFAELEGLPTVVSYMYDRYGIDPVASEAGMEEVFNYLYADAISPVASDETLNSYWRLIRMYSRAIALTTPETRYAIPRERLAFFYGGDSHWSFVLRGTSETFTCCR